VVVEAKRLVVALSLDVTGDGYVADGTKIDRHLTSLRGKV
jgi:hypothetical protein